MVEEVAGGGGATRLVIDDDLLGSSYVGGGKTGELGTFPVPDGPPHPTRRRAVGPLDAAASCCCRANTSLPLVTYPA